MEPCFAPYAAGGQLFPRRSVCHRDDGICVFMQQLSAKFRIQVKHLQLEVQLQLMQILAVDNFVYNL